MLDAVLLGAVLGEDVGGALVRSTTRRPLAVLGGWRMTPTRWVRTRDASMAMLALSRSTLGHWRARASLRRMPV